MFKAFSKLTAADWSVVITGLAVVVALEFLPDPARTPANAPPIQAVPATDGPQDKATSPSDKTLPGLPDIPLYGPETVGRVAKLPKGPSPARTAYDKFRYTEYFGAFAVNDKGAFGWSAGYGNMVAARRAALSFCSAHGQKCAVVAERVPADLKGPAPANTLSYRQSQAYLTFLYKQHPAALFTAVDGAYGVATGRTVFEASRTALAICKKNLSKNSGLKDIQCHLRKVWK